MGLALHSFSVSGSSTTFIPQKKTLALPVPSKNKMDVKRDSLKLLMIKSLQPKKKSCAFLEIPFSCWYESHVRCPPPLLHAGVRESYFTPRHCCGGVLFLKKTTELLHQIVSFTNEALA